MRHLLLLAPLILAACDAVPGGPAFVSGMSPAAAQSANAMPQPPNSLPPGFAGIGGGPNATAPNFASITLPTPF